MYILTHAEPRARQRTGFRASLRAENFHIRDSSRIPGNATGSGTRRKPGYNLCFLTLPGWVPGSKLNFSPGGKFPVRVAWLVAEQWLNLLIHRLEIFKLAEKAREPFFQNKPS